MAERKRRTRRPKPLERIERKVDHILRLCQSLVVGQEKELAKNQVPVPEAPPS